MEPGLRGIECTRLAKFVESENWSLGVIWMIFV